MAQFAKGQSGNPAGRPKGSRNKTTRFMELLEDDLADLIAVLRDKALDGDMNAMRLLLDRLVPKQGVVSPETENPNPITAVQRTIVKPPQYE